jgi:hypothetical protein
MSLATATPALSPVKRGFCEGCFGAGIEVALKPGRERILSFVTASVASKGLFRLPTLLPESKPRGFGVGEYAGWRPRRSYLSLWRLDNGEPLAPLDGCTAREDLPPRGLPQPRPRRAGGGGESAICASPSSSADASSSASLDCSSNSSSEVGNALAIDLKTSVFVVRSPVVAGVFVGVFCVLVWIEVTTRSGRAYRSTQAAWETTTGIAIWD